MEQTTTSTTDAPKDSTPSAENEEGSQTQEERCMFEPTRVIRQGHQWSPGSSELTTYEVGSSE